MPMIPFDTVRHPLTPGTPPVAPAASPPVVPPPIVSLLSDIFKLAMHPPGVVPPASPSAPGPAPHSPFGLNPTSVVFGAGIMLTAAAIFGGEAAVGALALYGAYKLFQRFRASHP